MRYYECTLNTSSERIKEKSKVKLNDVQYNSVVGAMTHYLNQNLINTIKVISCDQNEGNGIQFAFAFDNNTHSLDDAYGIILNTLNDVFDIKKIDGEPYEITSTDFYKIALEAKRRGLYNYYCSANFIEATQLET